MSTAPVFRPRSRLRDAFERWVLRASLAIDVRMPVDAREDLADEAMEAALQVIFRGLEARRLELELQTAGIDRDLERERRARVAHHQALLRRREAAVYDREHGFEVAS